MRACLTLHEQHQWHLLHSPQRKLAALRSEGTRTQHGVVAASMTIKEWKESNRKRERYTCLNGSSYLITPIITSPTSPPAMLTSLNCPFEHMKRRIAKASNTAQGKRKAPSATEQKEGEEVREHPMYIFNHVMKTFANGGNVRMRMHDCWNVTFQVKTTRDASG